MPVYPGDPNVVREYVADYNEAGYRVSYWHMGSHVGTHVDAPLHYIPGGGGVHQLPLEALIGRARVMDLRHYEPGQEMDVADLAKALPSRRMLLCTGWDRYVETTQYFTGMPGLCLSVAKAAVEGGMMLIGTDAPNIHATQWVELHQYLLSAGVVLVEGLTGLAPLVGQDINLVVAPLPLVDGDGAPARVYASQIL